MGYVLDQKRIDEALDYLSRRTREGFHGSEQCGSVCTLYNGSGGPLDTARISAGPGDKQEPTRSRGRVCSTARCPLFSG